MKFCVILLLLDVFECVLGYKMNVTADRKRIGSLSIGENEITDYDSSRVELQISTRNEPFETQDLFEGDILNVNMQDLMSGQIEERLLQKPSETWENGIIPYEISPEFDPEGIEVIKQAFLQYHKHTCLKFLPRDNETDYIFIQPGQNGCSSSVGRQEGKQEVNLGTGCLISGIAQHELMHAIGFWHEQSRPDRDQFITIKWENIQDGKELNFLKHSWNLLDLLTMPYDVASLMHYGPFAFAKDPHKPTIVVNEGPEADMGQRKHFSKLDLEKINKLYKCDHLIDEIDI